MARYALLCHPRSPVILRLAAMHCQFVKAVTAAEAPALSKFTSFDTEPEVVEVIVGDYSAGVTKEELQEEENNAEQMALVPLTEPASSSAGPAPSSSKGVGRGGTLASVPGALMPGEVGGAHLIMYLPPVREPADIVDLRTEDPTELASATTWRSGTEAA